MLYTFHDAGVKDRRLTQYFEMKTNCAVYHDGWTACCRVGTLYPPRRGSRRLPENAVGTLQHRTRLQPSRRSCGAGARKAEGLARLVSRRGEDVRRISARPASPNGWTRNCESREFRLDRTYYGNSVWLPEPIGPQLFPRAYLITAELTIPAGGAEGVVTCAVCSAGWSLYIQDGKPAFRYTGFEISDVTIAGDVAVAEGKVTLKTEFIPDGTKEDSGTLKLFVDGKPAGEGRFAARSSDTAWNRSKSAAIRSPPSLRRTKTAASSNSRARSIASNLRRPNRSRLPSDLKLNALPSSAPAISPGAIRASSLHGPIAKRHAPGDSPGAKSVAIGVDKCQPPWALMASPTVS